MFTPLPPGKGVRQEKRNVVCYSFANRTKTVGASPTHMSGIIENILDVESVVLDFHEVDIGNWKSVG